MQWRSGAAMFSPGGGGGEADEADEVANPPRWRDGRRSAEARCGAVGDPYITWR